MRLRLHLVALLFLGLSFGRGSEAGEGAQSAPTVVFNLKEGLLQQRSVALETVGESLTIMCVGESGVGKTTLLSNIFARQMGGQRSNRRRWKDEPTHYITERLYSFDIEGLPFNVRLIDTPGYGDSSNLRKAFRRVVKYLDKRFEHALKSESSLERHRTRSEHEATNGVDALLYFFAPHRCKGADVEYLRAVQEHAPIVPILAKADTMTSDELQRFRKLVVDKLRAARVKTFCSPFAIISSPLEPVKAASSSSSSKNSARHGTGSLTAAKPLNETYRRNDRSNSGARMSYGRVRLGGIRGNHTQAVLDTARTPNVTGWLPSGGRVYHWGTAEPENPLHSDLPRLRRFLLFEKLADLHYAKVQCYERYRRRRLTVRRTLLRVTLPLLLACAALLPKFADEGIQERLEYFLPIFAPVIRVTSFATRRTGMLLQQAFHAVMRSFDATERNQKLKEKTRRVETTPRPVRASRRAPEVSKPLPTETEEARESENPPVGAGRQAPSDERGVGEAGASRERARPFFSERVDYDDEDWEGTDVRALQQAQLREQAKMREESHALGDQDDEARFEVHDRDRTSSLRGGSQGPTPLNSEHHAPTERAASENDHKGHLVNLDRGLVA